MSEIEYESYCDQGSVGGEYQECVESKSNTQTICLSASETMRMN